MWQQWVNGMLGIAAVVASYVYIPSGSGRVLLMVIGIAVAVLAFWGAAEHARRHGNAFKV